MFALFVILAVACGILALISVALLIACWLRDA